MLFFKNIIISFLNFKLSLSHPWLDNMIDGGSIWVNNFNLTNFNKTIPCLIYRTVKINFTSESYTKVYLVSVTCFFITFHAFINSLVSAFIYYCWGISTLWSSPTLSDGRYTSSKPCIIHTHTHTYSCCAY